MQPYKILNNIIHIRNKSNMEFQNLTVESFFCFFLLWQINELSIQIARNKLYTRNIKNRKEIQKGKCRFRSLTIKSMILPRPGTKPIASSDFFLQKYHPAASLFGGTLLPPDEPAVS